ncbi:secreted antigen 1 [Babesia caballi]|uniref:Secreted antigen 1 n=1 Tax=Babesia caballi TaxID=5871 RepID=A0AAV4LRM4_BABCB|nr:secreted antigen 1 [Babesia caballi]
MASGSESVSCGSQVIEEPQTLKDALDFLAALGNNQTLVTQVAKKLSEKAGMYFNKHLLTGGAYHINRRLSDALKAANNVRDAIVNTSKGRLYKPYEVLLSNADCANTCVTFILELLPKLHVTLYYLYFKAGTNFRSRGGADWATYKCNDEHGDLYKWFTDGISNRIIGDSEAKLLPGGYNGRDELKDTSGENLGGELSNLVDPEVGDGYLQKLLFSLSFNISFSRVSTAAAVSCIDAFCKAVTREVIDVNGAYDNLKPQLSAICAALLVNLKPLTTASYRPKFLESLFQDSENDLVKIFRDDAYNSYVEWLQDRLPVLIRYLYDMQKNCGEWDPSSIYYERSVGPFAYGFMFGPRWRRNQPSVYEALPKLKTIIAKLTGECASMNDGTIVALLKCLNPTSSNCTGPSYTSSPTVNHDSGSTSGTVAITAEENKTETPEQIHQEAHPPVRTPDKGARAAEPAAATQSQSNFSTAFSSESSAASIVSSPAESRQTTPVSDTSGNISGSQEAGLSGTIYSASCSAGESCPDNGEAGSTGGINDSGPESRKADDVTNAQSTITIGGATGGVAVIGGGCAALYFLNVGGIKTLITGVP